PVRRLLPDWRATGNRASPVPAHAPRGRPRERTRRSPRPKRSPKNRPKRRKRPWVLPVRGRALAELYREKRAPTHPRRPSCTGSHRAGSSRRCCPDRRAVSHGSASVASRSFLGKTGCAFAALDLGKDFGEPDALLGKENQQVEQYIGGFADEFRAVVGQRRDHRLDCFLA